MTSEMLYLVVGSLATLVAGIVVLHYGRSLDVGLARNKLFIVSFWAVLALAFAGCFWWLNRTLGIEAQAERSAAPLHADPYSLATRLSGKAWAPEKLTCADATRFVRKENILLSYGSDNQITHQYRLIGQDNQSLIAIESDREVTFTFYADQRFFYGDTTASGRFRLCPD